MNKLIQACSSLVTLFLLMHLLHPVNAQVAVNSDATPPDPYAMLDVRSFDKGILFPRMTTAQRDLIPAPAMGLMIYNTSTHQFNFYLGKWAEISSSFVSGVTGSVAPGGGVSLSLSPGDTPDPSAMLDVESASRGVLIPRNNPSAISSPAPGLITYDNVSQQLMYFNGTSWKHVTTISADVAAPSGSQTVAGMAINTSGEAPHHSALLDISSASSGLLIPRITGSQRNEILPAEGLLIYNTTDSRLEFFNGTSWMQMDLLIGNTPCPGIPSITYGGQIYNTVQIGGQCWLRENLSIGTMINAGQESADNGIMEKYCYQNLESNCTEYGGFYQWAELVQYYNGATSTTSWNPVPTEPVQGLCPTGWHVPTDAEWTVMLNYLGGRGVACCKVRETGTAHWPSPNTCATNSSGFTALPAGDRYNGGMFFGINMYTNIWSATEYSADHAWNYYIDYTGTQVLRDMATKKHGFAARCVKDTLYIPLLPEVTTSAVTDITSTSAIVRGNVTSEGGTYVISRGIYFSQHPNPSMNDSVLNSGTGGGEFIINLTGLIPNTAYYLKAFATNMYGTVYGETVMFTTFPAQVFIIGQVYGGGIIFYIDETTQHGLICAPNDHNAQVTWGCKGTTIPGTSPGVGAGMANTQLILNGCSEPGIAAQVCSEFSLSGYDDWYLPSEDELFLLWQVRSIIGGFNEFGRYWSSTEAFYPEAARSLGFYFGSMGNSQKDFNHDVRPIRSF